MTQHVTYHTLVVEGAPVFYREAGDPSLPKLVLFHGFPTSSSMFRELIPRLADAYHIIAPDYPGFGQSGDPDRKTFAYTFDHLAKVMEAFLVAKGFTDFSMYVFDYGAPIGFRLALWHPDWIRAIISQNGNVYEAGLGKKWEARAAYWAKPTAALREQYKAAFQADAVIGQYTGGEVPGSVSPDGYTLDLAAMAKAGRDEIQSDLIWDYQTNVRLYPAFQQYLRENQPPVLCVWGKNDPSFLPAGAEAFKKDVPQARVELLDGGHFVLETHGPEIADKIRHFLSQVLHE